ncbi:hypothetical protein [Prevotella falsenii]
MKKLILGLFAMGMFAIAPATSVASNSNMVAANCPEGVKKADPKAFTDKLVKDLKLDKKQAKALLKLNTEYAEVLVCPHAKGKAKSDCKEGMSHKMGDSRKAAGCCKESNGNCKKGTDSCKKAAGDCKKGEGNHCDKQGKSECKGEGGQCDKQKKSECKGEGNHCDKQKKSECKGEGNHCDKQNKSECKGEGGQCDKQKKSECMQRANDMKAKRTAYLAELKKILNDKQYQQYLKM